MSTVTCFVCRDGSKLFERLVREEGHYDVSSAVYRPWKEQYPDRIWLAIPRGADPDVKVNIYRLLEVVNIPPGDVRRVFVSDRAFSRVSGPNY